MADKRIAVVGIPGKWSTETLADALESRTGFRLVVSMDDVVADVTGRRLMWRDVNLCDMDGLVVKKITELYDPNALDRLEMLRIAEACGARVFSPAESMLRLVDRLACTVTLGNAGIPMPETRVTESTDAAFDAVKSFGAAVFKPLFSTKARGMEIIGADQPDDAIHAAIARFKSENQTMYIQRKLDLSGQDLGMVFLGGSYLGTYARVSGGDAWNTTINSGGKYAPFDPEPAVIEMATRAQALFNLDFTTVDVALTDQGPIVFEVSAFGGFRGAKEGAGLDAAGLYADHALKELS